MRLSLAIVAFALSGSANADYTCDYSSGNCYYTNPSWNGGVDVRGYNWQNGSQWSQHVDPNGDQHGFDSKGNYWRYDSGSGNYWNSDGTVCYGTGASRQCY
jgi:hypothetical protein